MHWYTADTHFGHDNIIRYCKRPFKSSREMDAKIVANIRNCVAEDDDLWIVGDFAFGKNSRDKIYLNEIFEALPGRKHLVVGNHDGPKTLELPWETIEKLVEVKDGSGKSKHTLCHYPMVTWNGFNRGALQLFGHVHDKWLGSRKSINVGVDVWGFGPIKFEDIAGRASGLPEIKYWEIS
ncbi:MAG: metallophosphoesterase [Albidovulum sp.]|nr:metallophosphoesterase [Albidovulum sp.]